MGLEELLVARCQRSSRLAAVKLRHEGKELRAPFPDGFKGQCSKDFGVQTFAAVCDALYCSFLPKPPAWPSFNHLSVRSRAPKLSQAVVDVAGESNLEAVWVVVWVVVWVRLYI